MPRARWIVICALVVATVSGVFPASTAPAQAHRSGALQRIADGDYPGDGKRVIYSRSERRVWLVRADDHLSATWKVTGHPTLPASGTYAVFSRAISTRTYDGKYTFGHMVRFARSPRGSTMGFHDVPYLTGTSIPIMPLNKIGQPGYSSSGCIRQSLTNALRMWAWARIGTEVVVID